MAIVWTIGKDELIEAAEVMDMVPARPGIPASEFFQVERTKRGIRFCIASEVTAEVYLEGDGEWPADKAFYLDRRVFLPFVFAARDLSSSEPFVFRAKKKQLLVRQGVRRARFDGQKAVAGYGFPPKAELVSKLALGKELRGLVHCARECATADPVAPQLNCVYVKPNGGAVHVFATNQKILFKAEAKAKFRAGSAIPFPLYLVQLLGSDRLKAVHWKRKYVSLMFRHGRVWQPVSKKARLEFPVKPIVKYMKQGRQAPVLFAINSRKFAKVLGRLCMYLAAVRRQDWTLVMTGEKKSRELLLSSSSPHSVFNERVQLKKPLRADVKVSWPLDMLQPVFTFIVGQPASKLLVRVDKAGHSYVKAGQVELVIPPREK